MKKLFLCFFTGLLCLTSFGQAEYADVVLDAVFDGSAVPNPGPGDFDYTQFTDFYGQFDPENSGCDGFSVEPEIATGNTPGFISLPTGSSITLGFTDNAIFNAPNQNDIFIEEIGASSEMADVYISEDGVNFIFFAMIDGGTVNMIDLDDIGFNGLVTAIQIVGQDALGCSPGFDLVSVYGLPGASCAANASTENPDSPFCFEELPINLMDYVTGNTTGTWSGTGVSNNTFDLNPPVEGAYELMYVVDDPAIPACPSDTTTITVVLSTPAPPTIDAPVTEVCDGESVVLTASGGTNYLWSTSETTAAIVVNSSGTYTVTVSDDNGCMSSANVEITVNPLPAVPTIGADGPTSFCDGESVTLTSSAASGNVWSTGETTNAITVSTSGTYSVTTTDANGCEATSAATTVTVNAQPAVPTIGASGTTTFCDGESVTLTSSAANGNMWSTGETSSAITVTTSGDYSVVVTTPEGCSATSVATTVTVNPLPAMPMIAADGPTDFCLGSSVTLSIDAAGNDILWSNGETTDAITVNESGSLSVTVTDANGCAATSAVQAVNVLGCISVQNPCNCLNNATDAQDDGQLTDEVLIEGVTGDDWTVEAITGGVGIAVGDALVETPAGSGNYILTVTHVDGEGYAVTVTNGTLFLDASNTCYYPDIDFMIPDTLCAFEGEITLFGSASLNGSGVSGNGVFSIDGNSPFNTVDPALLAPGVHTVTYDFTSAGIVEGDAGCTQSLSKDIFTDACDDCAFLDRVCDGNALYVANFSFLWQGTAGGPLPFVGDLVFTWTNLDSGDTFVNNGTMYLNPTEIGTYSLVVTSLTDPMLQYDTCFGKEFVVDEIIDCKGCGN